MYTIHLGIPEMKALWDELKDKVNTNTANGQEEKLYKRFGKAMYLLSGLHSHEITELTSRYGLKVWESYLENNTPSAGRIFWVYGPERADITIIALEPHPNDKSNAYRKITLSDLP